MKQGKKTPAENINLKLIIHCLKVGFKKNHVTIITVHVTATNTNSTIAIVTTIIDVNVNTTTTNDPTISSMSTTFTTVSVIKNIDDLINEIIYTYFILHKLLAIFKQI